MNTKITPCKVCGARSNWDRDCEITDTGSFVSVWRCRNCSTTKVCGKRIAKVLPDRPTADDLTTSQRRTLARITSYTADADATVTLRGCGRTLFVSTVQYGWFYTTYTIGARGKITKL